MKSRLFPDGAEGCPQDIQHRHTRTFRLELACRVKVQNVTPKKAVGAPTCPQVSNLLSQTLTTRFRSHHNSTVPRTRTRLPIDTKHVISQSLSTEFSVLVFPFNSSPKSLFSSPTRQSSPLAATKMPSRKHHLVC